MNSDHKPVVGLYEVDLLKPLRFFPEITKEQNPDGLFKFYNIRLDFDILLWPEMQKIQRYSSPPLELFITFYG